MECIFWLPTESSSLSVLLFSHLKATPGIVSTASSSDYATRQSNLTCSCLYQDIQSVSPYLRKAGHGMERSVWPPLDFVQTKLKLHYRFRQKKHSSGNKKVNPFPEGFLFSSVSHWLFCTRKLKGLELFSGPNANWMTQPDSMLHTLPHKTKWMKSNWLAGKVSSLFQLLNYIWLHLGCIFFNLFFSREQLDTD